MPLPKGEDFQFLEISLDPDKSVVPRSQGSRRKTSDEVKIYTLLKLAHSIYREFFSIKNRKFNWKKIIILIFLLKTS